ncbi:P27 family predicted phage terminase small subunit [Ochrobactrum sp. RH1CCR137]|nr:MULTISPECIES: phage terminase small subunit P27 family [unclassified Ochrobactrum]MBA8844383.1 P27 family predicted phage terminase small subunit [Ochrobactrum sp. RH1CCR137]MBA8855737.1 P27 family predicted phage terminase small subunit [Ochrobactrum sp. RH1CCR134]
MSTRGRKAELKTIEGGLSGVPKAPAEIPACMLPEWNAVAADLVERKLLTVSMIGVLSTYIIALWSVREAQKAIAEHGLLVSGAHKALKPNPACGMLSKSSEQVARLSAELGLTPSARSKQQFSSKKGGAHDGAPPGLDY